MIRYHRTSKAVKNTTVAKHALALLSVCRQIFAETALLPFSLNTFSVFHPVVFNMWIKSFYPAFVMEELNKQGEEIRGFYELANGGIKVNLTRIIE